MYTTIPTVHGSEAEEGSSRLHGRDQWLSVLSALTGVPFFLHGYFPVILLLVLNRDPGGGTIANQLLGSLLHDGTSLWPYIGGATCALAANASLVDSYGRKTTMHSVSWALSLLLLLLVLAPTKLIGGGCPDGVSTAAAHTPKLFESLQHAIVDASYGEIILLTMLGFLVNLFVLSSFLYAVEAAVPTLRGYTAAQAVRQTLYGVMTACIVMTSYSVSKQSDAESVQLSFRWHYALPLLLTAGVGIALAAYPESPYWLMAQRTPAGIGTVLISTMFAFFAQCFSV